MQITGSINSSPVNKAPPLTAAQVHQSQLEDYELLLSSLRAEVRSLDHFSQTLLRPRTHSPLDQANEAGQLALQELMKDSDYQALCRKNNVSPHDLTVTLKDGTYCYETSNRENQGTVTLVMKDIATLQALKVRIEKATTALGWQLRSDRLVTLPRMATFYGMAPWNPTNAAEHQAAIDTLEERIASYRLGLEDDFNVLNLSRSRLEKSHLDSSESLLSQNSQDRKNDQLMSGVIKDTLNSFLPNGISLLQHLGSHVFESSTTEQVRAQPTAHLEKILQSPNAKKLENLLLVALDWYGGKPGEQTSPHIATKVLANALQIWFISGFMDYSSRIAGYHLHSSSNWGKSYQAIWREFEKHLLTTKRATSEKEAIVLARLHLRQFPTEFRVTNIPADLPYKSSLVWVNFVNGVNLIHANDPQALSRQTFQQLVNQPLQRIEGATQAQSDDVSLARLLPTLDWAVTQGIIPQQRYEEYSQTDLEQALAELDKHNKTLYEAIDELDKEPPKRLAIAKTVAENVFGKDFVNEGPKLARKRSEWVRWNSVPPLPGKDYDHYKLVDILAANEFHDQLRWHYTLRDGSLSSNFFTVDSRRRMITTFDLKNPTRPPVLNGLIPDVKAQFAQAFENYLEQQATAYKTLISSLLASLTLSDRQAIEWGELKIYTLRKETYRVQANHETPEIILPLRARRGLLLQTTYRGVSHMFELLPTAGVIRRIENLRQDLIGGVIRTENWPIGIHSNSVEVLRHQTLPFDWKAHSTGSAPQDAAQCEAIVEQLGQTLMAPAQPTESLNNIPLTINSSRSIAIANLIATQLPFKDPKALRVAAYGTTEFENEKVQREKTIEIIKLLVPFWKSIDDISSDDTERAVNGAFGLSLDLAAFALPIGKFTSGSIKLIGNASRLTMGMRLTSFASLTKELLILTLQALNPVDGIALLLRALGRGGLKLVRSGFFKIRKITGKAGQYNFVHSLPQVSDAGRWKPLVNGDQLATIRGVEDIPVRNLAPLGKADYRLIDPLSSRPYGPSLPSHPDDLSLGRSHYATLDSNSNHITVELPETSHIREVLEVDGRTTLFVNHQPYRLKNDVLHRAELLNSDDIFKAQACRVRRAPGASLCKTSYVLRDPAPTPDIGSFDKTKGWAPWFGDIVYSPATGRAPMRLSAIHKHATVKASLEFQKGIFGRVMVSVHVPGQKLADNFRVGSIIVEAVDGSKHYVFMRLNAGDFFVAERAAGQSVHDILTFKKASSLPNDLKDELLVVYTGSLNANNMVRIHGQRSVERALKAMDEIAIPIGGHANPPETLKWLKVDTSPGEAALFDHSTRMIIRNSTDGAASWSLSKAAPDSVRETTAEIFNNLFGQNVITVSSATQTGAKALKIDDTMMQLQRLISRKTRRPLHNPRNIAFAEIKTRSGAHEVYVSVSGNQGDTGFLPLFAKNPSTQEIKVGSTSYFNIDHGKRFPATALEVTPQGKLQAIPHTIGNIEAYTPVLTSRPTSLDTESKLISVIRGKYPDPKELNSITIATTLAPCDSCSVVMKQFGHDGSANALDVIWK